MEEDWEQLVIRLKEQAARGEFPDIVKRLAESRGIPLDEVPWQCMFISDESLSEKDIARGLELARRHGWNFVKDESA